MPKGYALFNNTKPHYRMPFEDGRRDISLTLSEDHWAAGLTLSQDDDFIYLFLNGREVDRWYTSIKVTTIHAEADKYVHPGVTFEVQNG